jgi:dihydrofolate reductase
MRKLIYQVNVSLDGFADHTAGIVDAELHDFFTAQYDGIDTQLLGRVTYELMEYWHHVKDDPAATKDMLRFAERYLATPKVVFSRTLAGPLHAGERLVSGDPAAEVARLKRLPGKNMAIGGISLAGEVIRKGLVDEYLILVHPVIAGKGRRLFEGLQDRTLLKLIGTQVFRSGIVVLRYEKG